MAEFVIPRELQRSLRRDEAEAERSALVLLDLLAGEINRPVLDAVSILDIGCGVKFTQAIISNDVPIGSYTGVDVHEPVISYLRSAVTDARFRYHHVNFHNARYNPTGERMTADSRLPVEEPSYDVICGFSLFTHLNPEDFEAMLAITRRYSHDATRLVFTAFIDAHTAGGHGLIDRYTKALGYDVSTGEKYRDFVADDVLRVALYSNGYVRDVIHRSGWSLVSVKEPSPYTQHLFTLEPR
jgi:SAM-dependent methyltransferase